METQPSIVKKKTALILANFGGPRNLEEIESFLIELLCDQEVVRTPLPKWLHQRLFKAIAKKRVGKVQEDYKLIGGKSPIYEDTLKVAEKPKSKLPDEIIIFQRYLPSTHLEFINQVKNCQAEKIIVFPFFPQFSTSTSGSIAKWFNENLPQDVINKLFWLKSYPKELPFTDLFAKRIEDFISDKALDQDKLVMLFSAHGVPQKFIKNGDPYQSECEASFNQISKKFPLIRSILCYQSKFGYGQWIKPYTVDVSKNINEYAKGKTQALFIPLAFTSDHIETLFEIENDYMPLTKKNGLTTYRLNAFNAEDDWISTIEALIKNPTLTKNDSLIRR